MAIEEVIDVTVLGVGELGDLADASDKAAESIGRLKSDLASLGGGADLSSGAGKFAGAWDDAAARVSASVDKIGESLGKLDGLGVMAGGGGPADLAARWDTAAADISASIDKIAESGGKLGDIGDGIAGAAGEVKGLGDAGDVAAGGLGRAADAAKGLGDSAGGLGGLGDGLKGLGGDADALAAEIAAAGAEMDKLIAKGDALSARSAVSGASAASLNAKVESSGYLATSSVEQDVANTRASKQAAADAEAAEASAGKYHMLALGSAAALAYGVDKAAQLQTSVTRLYTTAGESQANLPMMSAGILKLSGQTNTSQAQLGQGAYMIESAGYHGQNALGVLKAAAEGAQAEGAPLGDTANALTSLMNAYGVPKGQSASKAAMSGMDQIIAMVSRGKMTMAGAVGALPDVLPAASAAHLSFSQVGGALSTITSMGVSPERAAQNLSHVITSIENPNAVQTKEMQQLGLNPVSIENNLGKTGLTGTFQLLSDTVMKSMGPAGDVLFKTFNQSKSAAADATTMISAMPASIRGAAEAYADGKTSAKQWNAEVFSGSESAKNKNLLQQFATVENQANGFNELLKSGSPAAQTYAAAMSKLTGGQTGLNVAMELTNSHAATFKSNTDAIAASAQHAGANVTGWSKVQQTLNFQLGSFEKTSQAVATEAGQTILPTLTTAMKGLSTVGGFLASNPEITKPLVEAGGVLAGVTVASKVASAGTTALASVGKVAETLHIPGLSSLANLGKDTGAAGLDTAAGGLKGSAADLTTAAGDLSTAAADLKTSAGDQDLPHGGEPGAIPVGKGSGEAAAGEDAAEDAGAGLGIGALVKGTAGTVGLGLIISAMVDQQLKGIPSGPDGRNWLDNPFGEKNGTGIASWAPEEKFFSAPPSAAEESQFQSRFGISVPGYATPAREPAARTGASALFTATLGQAMASTKLAAPNLSALDAAKAKVQADISDIDHIISAGKAAHIPAPDLSALETAKSKAAADLSAIDRAIGAAGKTPAKMAAPDLSPLDSAKTRAMSGGEGIQQAAQQAVAKPVRAAAPDLSPYVAARGQAASDGAAIDAGLAQGIAANAGAAVSAAESVANQVSAVMAKALDTHSPSKVTEKIGKDTVAGLVLGLEGGKSAVTTAAQDVAAAVTKPWSDATITSTYGKLTADLKSAFKDKSITAGQDSAYTKTLAADNTRLQSLAHQRSTLESQISAADSYASNVQSSAISSASIVNVAGNITSAGSSTSAPAPAASYQASDLIAGEKAQLLQLQQFRQSIAEDKKLGLNTTELGQIIQSGASTGLPIAQAIASGGKGAVSQLNQIQSETNAAAKALGVTSANAMYESGSQIGQGLAAGLKSELSGVESAIVNTAEAMIKKFEAELKIHSPSLAFAERAAMVPAGVAAGIDANAGQAAAAVGRMGSRMTGAFHPAMAYAGHGGGSGGSSGASGSGGGGDTYHVTVNVSGSVTSEQNLVNAVQRGLLKKGSVNWQTGARRPGSAG